jgi:hypothetical protein
VNELENVFNAVSAAKNWINNANCKGMDTNLFFPHSGANLTAFVTEVCDTCTVQEECLWYANETHSDSGIFGGMAPKKRMKWRSRNRVELGMSKKEWEASQRRAV